MDRPLALMLAIAACHLICLTLLARLAADTRHDGRVGRLREAVRAAEAARAQQLGATEERAAAVLQAQTRRAQPQPLPQLSLSACRF